MIAMYTLKKKYIYISKKHTYIYIYICICFFPGSNVAPQKI